MHRTISRQENITYSSPRQGDTWFPSITPKECRDGRNMLTSQPKFLGWRVYQIILAMGFRSRARGTPLLKNQKLKQLKLNLRTIPFLFSKELIDVFETNSKVCENKRNRKKYDKFVSVSVTTLKKERVVLGLKNLFLFQSQKRKLYSKKL